MKIPVIDRLNIGRRLTLCFVVIISFMLAGNGLLLWQFHLLHLEADRLTSVSQKLIAILRLHTSLLSFDAKLNGLAQSEDVDRLAKETEPLRVALVEESQRARNTLTHLPADIQLEPAFVPTLEAIEITLPSQLEAITGLAKSGDWKAVRLRLANENKPLEAQTSALVTRVEEQLSAEQAQALAKAALVQRRIFLIVSLTGVLTLLIAAFLGLAITRSIAGPLGRLMEGSRSLAQGNFQHRVVVAGKDELAHLGGVFNDTAEKLSGLYGILRLREAYLAEAQKLSHTGNFGWNVSTDEIHWSAETFRIFGYEPVAKVTPDMIVQRTHPEDCLALRQLIERASNERSEFALEHRLLMPEGSIKYVRVVGHPSTDECCHSEFVGAVTDITERKRAEEELRRGELELRQMLDLAPQLVAVFGPNHERLCANRVALDYLGLNLEEWQKRSDPGEFFHPDDRERVQNHFDRTLSSGTAGEMEFRLRKVDGSYRWFLARYNPVGDNKGQAMRWYVAFTDIEDRKHAEEELQQLVDFVRQIITVLSPNGKITYANRVAREYTGLTIDEYRSADVLARVIHPDDIERMRAFRERGFSANNPFEIEARTLGKDGVCRWFLYRYNPLRDEREQITRWYVTGTDIEDRKQAEDRLRQENVALREQIDQASMFENIVGTSPALKRVLSNISKVAPSDSTVLITGETGTGKEIVARAIHKHSQRSSHAFISVNCAAIPRDLIASELFGHEKGAFTGATQQRLGRFELASGGTIFLDEVGELPAETQVALLRVLQEREFERIGGTRRIRADVRVIAATNRELEAAIRAGSFRSDLFYRLNVFPIEIPPLRERREDIPLLVEYFIDRYARKAGKKIRQVNKKTFELVQSYPWPGNVRELQNVIERSVILCETETFSIDESWLPKRPSLTTETKNQSELPRRLLAQEKDMIEAALSESRGRVFGPTGAAAMLGIPRSTLESKIRSLKIDKNRFRNQQGERFA